MQFLSHKIYAVKHCTPLNAPAQPASILSLRITGKSILCTSAEPHGFKAAKVCGQLYSDQDPESLRPLVGKPLKVMSTPSTNEFTFLSPSKSLKPAILTEVSAELASGQLHVFFGYVHQPPALMLYIAYWHSANRTLPVTHMKMHQTCKTTHTSTSHECAVSAACEAIVGCNAGKHGL